MDRTTQLAVNELFERTDILSEELLKTRKVLKRHKVANIALFLYLTYTVLRHEVELDKLKNKDN